MGSSDESIDGEQLLSKFRSYRPNSSDSINAASDDHVQVRRRGRPPKVIPIVNLADSEEDQPSNSFVSRRYHEGSSSRRTHTPSVGPSQSSGSQQSHRRREAPPSHISSRSSVAATTSQPSGATASRSRRARAQVGNYYSNANYSGYMSSSENADEEAHEPLNSRRLPPPPQAKPNQRHRSSRIIYDSHGVRVCRHAFLSLEDIPALPEKVPYSPEAHPSNYGRRFQSDLQMSLLHVCFSDDEILAMAGLLSPYGRDLHMSDMSPVDQVIYSVQLIHQSRDRKLVKRIHKMAVLQKTIKNHGFDSFNAYNKATGSENPQINAQFNEIFTGKDEKASEYLKMAGALRRRRKADIRAFMKDAREGNLPTRPYYVDATYENVTISRTVRGSGALLQRITRQLPKEYSLHRRYTWKGASNDVVNLAWSPDGSKFAIGAAAQCDVHNMQYNRPNNLIIGDLECHAIKQLPDHRVAYPAVNANNTHLYMSVTAVEWFDDTLYTSSYDKTVKIWDVATYKNATCTRTLKHDSRVHIMARSHASANLLATGTDSKLYLWHFNETNETCHELDFLTQRSIRNPRMARNVDLLPASAAWGLSPGTRDLLVAGFTGKGYDETDACREGLLAMWTMAESSIEPVQLQPNAQNVFDVKFHPILPWVATGTSVPVMGTSGTGKDVRSLVRIYEPKAKRRCAMEFDCPALDMNDVSFCPLARFYVSASCTDGVTYVWDWRKPSQILHQLPHGEALDQLNEQLSREQADVGVRVALWGDTIDTFITGGSDGVLRAWNILRAPEDVHARDIVTLEDGIMSGSFSPDKSSLLIGDAAGGIHMLEPGTDSDYPEEFDFDRSCDYNAELLEASSESGRAIGATLLQTGQLTRHPKWGIGQGPSYKGPYAAWARPKDTPDDKISVTPLLREIQALQLDQEDFTRHTIPTRSPVASDRYRKTAEIRNRDPSVRKRKPRDKHDASKKQRAHTDIINLCSDDEKIDNVNTGEQNRVQIWIDLTSEPHSASSCVDGGLSDDDGEEDYWFPESCNVDPNICTS